MTHEQHQLPLFATPVSAPAAAGAAGADRGSEPAQIVQRPGDASRGQAKKMVMINPHLLAARRIAKRMRRLPDRSDAETRAGLAICARLKAFLAEGLPQGLAAGREASPDASPDASHEVKRPTIRH
jgi:hypothetical protein